MKALIAGAGVAGLALAAGLRTDGVDVDVLERADGPTVDGAAVTIYSNGAAALHGLGVDLDGCGGLIETLQIRRHNGSVAMTTDMTRMADRFGFGVRTVPRRDLIARLAAHAGDCVQYGTAVEGVTLEPPAVTTNGRTRPADVLVGADGYRSTVRRALGARAAEPVGWTTWQGLTPVLADIAAGTTGLLMVGAAGLVGMMPAGHGLTQWWFDVRWDEPGREATALDRLRREFAHFADPVARLLRELGDTEPGRYPHVAHQVEPIWGRGAVTLAGDAAHAFPPSQAQGANQALEDAWLLRRVLTTDDGDLDSRLRRYERARAQRVRLVSRMAVSERTNKPVPGPVAALTRLLPATASGRAYARLVRRFSSVLAGDVA